VLGAQTPKTQSKAGNTGDHGSRRCWPATGQVYDSSDKIAAYPKENPVAPEDLLATIHDALGIDPGQEIYDRENRPERICDGTPVTELFL
jgi:hypothetical protein